jgi:hypothetical protein
MTPLVLSNYNLTLEHLFRKSPFERCVERNVSPNELKDVILSGEVIENYPEDKYGPSYLIYGTTETGKILHVQCSIDPVWIVTVYDPTLKPEEWDESFKRRR